ncbi:MAG: T9SS type A sorting domain-containing protein [Flavobacteriales bacterium]|nr:T9SS type A sorting domain-containing protein [Flavobacteriales bacterium]
MRSTLLLGALVLLTSAHAQMECGSGRYTDLAFFDSVTVTSAVLFGNNIGVGGQPQNLYMDVYEPYGDTLSARPVVLVAFGGSFVAGSRADVADVCVQFAKLGYVAVAPDYRVGFFFPNIATTTQAVMRGAHDMRGCVRNLRKTVAEDANPFRIDVDRIITGGVSAGAISALHATYLDQPSEMPAVLVSDSAALGGIEGNSGSDGYSSDVRACYSLSGAIGDTSWIVPGDQPLVSVHEDGDEIVPCWTEEVSVFGIPTGLLASGSGHIHRRAEHNGLQHCFLLYPGNGHVGYLSSDQATSLGVVFTFLSDVVCGNSGGCGLQEAAIAEKPAPFPLNVYPNPSSGPIFIDVPENGGLELLDISGRIVLARPVRAGRLELGLEALNSGLYYFKIQGEHLYTTRVIVRK